MMFQSFHVAAILVISFLSALLTEGIQYVLLFRTQRYKTLQGSIDVLEKQLETKKTETNLAKQKSKEKKVSSLDELLKRKGAEMQLFKFKSMIVTSVVVMSLMALLNRYYASQVVARLPFIPFPILLSMSHRNLEGTDFTESGMIFIYVLCSMGIRANVTRFFNFVPIKRPAIGANPWAPPSSEVTY